MLAEIAASYAPSAVHAVQRVLMGIVCCMCNIVVIGHRLRATLRVHHPNSRVTCIPATVGSSAARACTDALPVPCVVLAVADACGGPLLCSEAEVLVQHSVKRPRVMEASEAPENVAAGDTQGEGGAVQAPVVPATGSDGRIGPGNYTASGSKVPKWLKMGK